MQKKPKVSAQENIETLRNVFYNNVISSEKEIVTSFCNYFTAYSDEYFNIEIKSFFNNYYFNTNTPEKLLNKDGRIENKIYKKTAFILNLDKLKDIANKSKYTKANLASLIFDIYIFQYEIFKTQIQYIKIPKYYSSEEIINQKTYQLYQSIINLWRNLSKEDSSSLFQLNEVEKQKLKNIIQKHTIQNENGTKSLQNIFDAILTIEKEEEINNLRASFYKISMGDGDIINKFYDYFNACSDLHFN